MYIKKILLYIKKMLLGPNIFKHFKVKTQLMFIELTREAFI